MEQTVNLSASTFDGSDPSFPTTLLSVHLVVQDTALSLPVHEFEPRTENQTTTLVSQNPGYCTQKKKIAAEKAYLHYRPRGAGSKCVA